MSFEQMETVELLMNAQHVSAKAYFVSNLCMNHFNGSLDQLNRSWAGEPPLAGESVVPFFRTMVHDIATNEVLNYMGIHGDGRTVNASYNEAYNLIWNFRAKNRSKDITLINELTNVDLQPAFWNHVNLQSIVSDVDFAAIDGEVPLNVTGGKMYLQGIGKADSNFSRGTQTARESDGTSPSYTDSSRVDNTAADQFYVRESTDFPGFPDMFVELADNGVTVSLSNLDLAKKTQAFAKLREQYAGHDEDWIIDQLMDAIRIPEQAFRQPLLIGRNSTIVGQAKRYATDSTNLTESVVSGMTAFDLSFRVPRNNVGGVVMVVVEALPEQLFERQADPYHLTTDHDTLPHYLRDVLDPEPVTVVKNEDIDLDHSTPTDTFGYAALNHNWNYRSPRVGGRFLRPAVDGTFDEDRQRIWTIEVANPTLSEEFHISTTVNTKPFADTAQDPYEVVTQGECVIEGVTHFGPDLMEENSNYDSVLAKADQTRISDA